MEVIKQKTEALLGVFRGRSLELASILLSIFTAAAGAAMLIYSFAAPHPIPSKSYNKAPFARSPIPKSEAEELSVDISGAVQKPGVYTLPAGSRVNDLIQKADGLSDQANYNYFALHINRAEKLQDQQKLYIPLASDSLADISSLGTQIATSQSTANGPSEGPVNINSAASTELENLPGVGKVTADKIVAGRPYASADDLSSRKILKKNIYDAIKDKINI